MDDLEDLKAKKERLLLEQEVARLERQARIKEVLHDRLDTKKWSWWWVGTLLALGLFCMGNGAAIVGIPMLIPTALKLFWNK